ncbi:MAG: hypothetical protein Q9166_002883 [cf. Caloplaca sp. 2 TL-2023]
MSVSNIHGGAHAKMGNTSSQPAPVTPGPRLSAHSRKRDGSSGERSGKRHPNPVNGCKSSDAEKESVSAQTFRSRHQTPSSNEDDAAAAAQIFAESSFAQGSHLPNSLDDSIDQINGLGSQRRRRGERKKKKRRLSVLEASSDLGNLQDGPHDTTSNPWSKVVGSDEENGIVVDHSTVLQPTQSFDGLDWPDEDDEGVSSLFHEYENQGAQRTSNLIDATLVNQALPTASAKLDPGKKRKRKHTRCSDTEESLNGARELLNSNGTGQHAFELDYEAFDEIFANEGTHLANPFMNESGYDIPHVAKLSEDSLFVPPEEALLVPPVHEDLPAESDADVAEVTQQRKLPWTPSASRRKAKRRRMEVPNSLDSQLPVYASSYAANEGQQDRVLPGFEDMQARSSSEIPYPQTPGLSHGISNASTDIQPKETPPPRLERPTKRRGNKKQRGGQKGKYYKPPLRELSEKGGMFRDDEIKVLESFRDRYCEEEEISKRRFNEIIQSNLRANPEAARLFNAIYEEIPYRTRQSVLKFCRRRFHNFSARGAFTEADDEELKDAVAKKGTSWIAVGAILDRRPEDCRDRYRNYIVNSEKRNTDSWTHEETRNLVKAVHDCIRLLQEEKTRAKAEKYEGLDIPESEPESDQEIQDLKLINWQVVSDRMGGTRSRLQCSYKFNHLKAANREYYLKVIRRLATGKGFKSSADSHTESWRWRQSKRKLRNMRPGDKYDFLQAFANCSAPTESNIPWSKLGSDAFRRRWSKMDLKAALKILKEEVPGSDEMNYQDIVNRVYTKLMAESPDLDDRWDAEVHGDINRVEKRQSQEGKPIRKSSTPQNQEQDGKSKRRCSRRKNKIKSEAVISSDDDEDNDKDRLTEEDKEEDQTEYEKRNPTPDESTENGSNRRESPEIIESTNEVGGTDERSKKNSVSRGNSIPKTASLHIEVSETSVSDTASDSDSDNSLFDGASNSDLVDRLELLREA